MIRSDNFPALYPILDTGFLPSGTARADFLRRLVHDLAGAGVEILQYRNKTANETEILADARIMREAAASNLLLILNDWPALAVEAGFDGVHVGQTDMSPAEARGIIGPEKIVGVSTHNEAQLREADLQPVDYVAFGPVYATATKENPDPVVGLEGIRMARRLTRKPLVAIGGIALANAAMVRRVGADSIAVISGVFGTGRNAAEAAREFLSALQLQRESGTR